MPRTTQRLKKRDNDVRKEYSRLKKKHPKYTIIAIIEEVSETFYLSPATIGKILKEYDEQVPATDTITKYTRQVHYV